MSFEGGQTGPQTQPQKSPSRKQLPDYLLPHREQYNHYLQTILSPISQKILNIRRQNGETTHNKLYAYLHVTDNRYIMGDLTFIVETITSLDIKAIKDQDYIQQLINHCDTLIDNPPVYIQFMFQRDGFKKLRYDSLKEKKELFKQQLMTLTTSSNDPHITDTKTSNQPTEVTNENLLLTAQ